MATRTETPRTVRRSAYPSTDDIWSYIPTGYDDARRARIYRSAVLRLIDPTPLRVGICAAALLAGLALTGLAFATGILLACLPAAAAKLVALIGWALWFARWE